MQQLQVKLGKRTYPIVIKPDLLTRAGELARQATHAEKLLLVSNPTVYNLYGLRTRETLLTSGFEVGVALIPDGEKYKNMEQAMKVLDQALEMRLERSDAIVALGGGVVGDLAGFVAAVYQRGIDFIQIPTTLLAQVDSSVGGKVAVNHPRGKNMIGAFYQPRLVMIDTSTLLSLTERDYKSGLGEVVKYGIACERSFFNYLTLHTEKILHRELECLQHIIIESCRIKGQIVESDERESGLRAVLNLGHTFGHSIEKLGQYNTYRHGEAVAMGTMAAAYLALDLGYLKPSELADIAALYHKLDIEAGIPPLAPQLIYEGMLNDKKVVKNRIKYVLPRGIGDHIFVEGINTERVIRAIIKAQA
ncbi:3-dehydroquinate synthase [Syntrophomonas erecta]